MPIVALVNRSRLADDDLAYYAAAVDAQLREDFLPRWQGVDYTPVTFFASEKDLPVSSGIARVIVVQDTIDAEGARGYHSFVGVPRSVVLAQGEHTSVTISHEVLEMTADPEADKWVTAPDGRHWALEVCDPCESDTYAKQVTIMGLTRDVLVSAFVDWSWFQPGGFQIRPGGYAIIQEVDGLVHDVWAETTPGTALRRTRKMLNSTSRTYRRGARP